MLGTMGGGNSRILFWQFARHESNWQSCNQPLTRLFTFIGCENAFSKLDHGKLDMLMMGLLR